MRRITVKNAVFAAGLVAGVGAVGVGCLSRPVVHQEPTTKTNFTAVVRQQAVDKVDILFMIDNSASMGDKQELLALAVPDLVSRLVNPNCLDASGNIVSVSTGGTCPANQKAEFPAVHDMHIGVVSSSLGGIGSDACPADAKNPTNAAVLAHNDDSGHLLNRGGADEHVVNDATAPSSFLAWFPSVDANKGKPNPPVVAIGDPNQLNTDFTDLVRGVHEYGCGFEAQLSSWYRFLVQPDPYAQVIVDPSNGARRKYDGFDDLILAQRAAFLRPDSLLTVIVVTDETEEVVDPLALGGQGWAYMNSVFPGSSTGGAPKGTQVCATNPNDPGCTTCAFAPNDPGCNPTFYDTADDNLNVRSFAMKKRYGIDPRYPVSRFVRGLTQSTVPDRDHEHVGGNANYTGDQAANCTNPVFATNLPTSSSGGHDSLCNLTRGPRTPDLVFYAIIGGVPHQLLQQNPSDPNSPQKDKLSDADWVKILGNDPLNYDFTGADPHMLQSVAPRPGLPPPTSPDNADPIHGREWDSNKGDLQFACVFNLKTQKDCTTDAFKNACDCENGAKPPLCSGANPNLQIKGKAYPSIRELSVARLMKDQAIVSSLCPIHETEQGAGDPLFGYRPAVKAIVDRLKNALANQCLPERLTPDAQGNVPCLILETLGQPGPESVCNDAAHGFSIPDATVLKKFREAQAAAASPGDHPEQFPVCAVTQLVGADLDVNGSCSGATKPGWCYVTGTSAGTCAQAILFSPTGNPQVGSSISLQCIEQVSTGTDAGTGGGG